MFNLNYLTLAKAVAVAAVITVLLVMLQITRAQSRAQKAEIGKLSAELSGVISTNEVNSATIEQLKGELKRTSASYDARLKQKDAKLNEILNVCNLVPTGGANETHGGDAVLDRLNGLWPKGSN